MIDDGSRFEPKRFNEDVLVHVPLQATQYKRTSSASAQKDFRFRRSGVASSSGAANSTRTNVGGFVGSPPRTLRSKPKSAAQVCTPPTVDCSAPITSSIDLRASMQSGASLMRRHHTIMNKVMGDYVDGSNTQTPSAKLTHMSFKCASETPAMGRATSSDDQALAALHASPRGKRVEMEEQRHHTQSNIELWATLFRNIAQSLQNCLRFVDKLEAHLRTAQRNASHTAASSHLPPPLPPPPGGSSNSLRIIATTRVEIRGLQACFGIEGELHRFGASIMRRSDYVADDHGNVTESSAGAALKRQLLMFALSQTVALLNASLSQLTVIARDLGNESLSRDVAHVMDKDCEKQLDALQESLVGTTTTTNSSGWSVTRNAFEQQRVLLLQSLLPSFAAWESSHRQLRVPCTVASHQQSQVRDGENATSASRPQSARPPKKDGVEGPRPPTPRVAGSGGFQHCRPRSAKSSSDGRAPVQPPPEEGMPMSKSAAVASVIECILTDEVRFQRAVGSLKPPASVPSIVAAMVAKGIEARAAELSRGEATGTTRTTGEIAESILSDIPWPLSSLRHLAHIATSTPHIAPILCEGVDGLGEAFVKLRKSNGEAKQSAPRTVHEWLVLQQRRWHPDVVRNGVERALVSGRLSGWGDELEELSDELKECAAKHSTFLAQVINRLKEMSLK